MNARDTCTTPLPTQAPAPFDRLSSLLERFRVRAHLFHSGPLCGVTHFAAAPGRGFLHVLRRGEMVVTHQPQAGPPDANSLTMRKQAWAARDGRKRRCDLWHVGPASTDLSAVTSACGRKFRRRVQM